MIFFFLFGIILALQVLHWHVLRRILSPKLRPLLPWLLALIHLPLTIYFALRLSGAAPSELGHALRPFARAGFYFQAFTAVHLFVLAISETLWWWRFRHHLPELETEAEAEVEAEDPVRRAFLRKVATAGFGAAAVGTGYGASEAYGDPGITRLTLSFPDLPPGLDGLKLVHLSDLHIGPMLAPKTVARWRALTDREAPDLLVVTGDFVDSLPGEIAPFIESFGNFPAPFGCFAILGNHDYFTDPRPIWKALEGGGFQCLENANRLVNRKGALLAVIGISDPMASNGGFRGIHFGDGPRPEVAITGIPDRAWRICLSHRPSNWDLAVRTGAKLTLSGHTHGGQVNIIPFVSSARMMGPYTQGLFVENGFSLYVSRGLGVVGIPMRLGAPPEIVVITLRITKALVK
jgi:predicted MPP superfamily phosphohydrolase